MVRKLLFCSLFALWALPGIAVLYSYYTGIIPLDPISASLAMILYSLIWFKISDKIIVRFGIPRAGLGKVEELSEKLGLRNLDPRLAYYIDKWLRSAKTEKEGIPRREERVQLRRMTIPIGEQRRSEGVARRRMSIREMYERLMEIQIEDEGLTGEYAGAATVAEEERRAEEEMVTAEERPEDSGIDEETLSKVISVFSKKDGCFLMKALWLGEFRAKDLKDGCGAHWQTVREWLNVAMELGIIAEEEDGYYRLDRERARQIMDQLLGGRGGS